MRDNPELRPRVITLFIAATLSLTAISALGGGYSDTVATDGPLAYYRFNDSTQRSNLNLNGGSLGAAGNATNLNVHLVPGAIVGSRSAATYFDSTARTVVPWTAALNPNATNSFTLEAWFYPTSDKVAGAFSGPAPIMNRYSYSGVDRQGWVYFQRNPDSSYASDGQTDVGWNFRTYVGSGSTVGIDVTSQVPYRLGQWQHVVTVWDGPDQTATMFIDGVLAATKTWSANGPPYVANTDDHPAGEAVNGPSGFGIGSYNNTQPGEDPFRGAIDEVAFYPKILTPGQIQAHYQNATNALRTTSYDALIKADGPVGYWRLDDPVPGADLAINIGLLQNAGAASNTAPIRHAAGGALAGETDGAYSFHWQGSGGTTADIPWTAENNPDAGVPFTFEAWLKPTADRMNPGPAPVNNRYKSSGNRTGWVIYQRDPNPTYTGSISSGEGVGWDFRMYTGSGSGGQDVTTYVPYTMGEWQHLVVTWEPQTDMGASGGGAEQWQGILTAFVNGVVATNANNKATTNNPIAVYAANVNPTEDGTAPADLAVGSYNAASGFGEEFAGNIDELAIYTNVVLTAAQVLAHYMAGTNSHPATNYETLVLTAGYDGAGTQAQQPATYLRFNEPPQFSASNDGTLGDAAAGSLVLTKNDSPGPVTSGFEPSNRAVPFDGTNAWVSLDNPPGLLISGQITLEAWVNPSAIQGDPARIISHGPATPTVADLTANPDLSLTGSLLSRNEVFLRIEGSGANYVVGSSDGTNSHTATFAVPAGDLGGGKWIHLVGTHDGSHWTLFRNGSQVATAADPVGALPVNYGEWAIGSAGMGWADDFAGAIDEVAIYNHALTPDRVQAHYLAATAAARPSVSISLAAGKVTLTWATGTLQQADQITGTFADVPGAASAYTIPANAATKFYRLRL